MKDEEIREEVIQQLKSNIMTLFSLYGGNKYEKVYALHSAACAVYDTDNDGNKEHFYSFLEESLHECINEHDGWDKIQWPENQH